MFWTRQLNNAAINNLTLLYCKCIYLTGSLMALLMINMSHREDNTWDVKLWKTNKPLPSISVNTYPIFTATNLLNSRYFIRQTATFKTAILQQILENLVSTQSFKVHDYKEWLGLNVNYYSIYSKEVPQKLVVTRIILKWKYKDLLLHYNLKS